MHSQTASLTIIRYVTGMFSIILCRVGKINSNVADQSFMICNADKLSFDMKRHRRAMEPSGQAISRLRCVLHLYKQAALNGVELVIFFLHSCPAAHAKENSFSLKSENFNMVDKLFATIMSCSHNISHILFSIASTNLK